MRRLKAQAALIERLKAPLEELPGGQDQWIRDSMDWLIDQFGRDVLTRSIRSGRAAERARRGVTARQMRPAEVLWVGEYQRS